MGSWMGAGGQKDQAMSRRFQPHPHSPGRGERLEIKLIDGSHLCDETSIKIPKVRGLGSFWVGEHMEVSGLLRESMDALHPFPHSHTLS